MNSCLRIVLSGTLANYPQSGGHWTVFLQYLFGLRALGHQVVWLELFPGSRDRLADDRQIQVCLRRFRYYGLSECIGILHYNADVSEPELAACSVHGIEQWRLEEVVASADLLWNFCSGMPRSLLPLFKHRVLVDLDPGILQASALEWDIGLSDHQAFLSIGCKLHDPDCGVPTLGVHWRKFHPFAHLPLWRTSADPGAQAPFSSITEWTWHTVGLHGKLLSASKRDAYLRYVDLPVRSGRSFALAANIDSVDDSGDRAKLIRHGWEVPHPHVVAKSPAAYRRFIRQSRAEIACTKPIYKDLRTGWLSDRSVCYLATGRPVLAEDTGFSDYLPTGKGLLTFASAEEAVEKTAEIDRDYALHQCAARELAEDVLSAPHQLKKMLDASQ
jgi:hypothetical protein